MAYLVLARKYRPQTFEEIVGQSHVTRTLVNAIRSDRVHHAYLLCGVRGLGKTTAARILAKCLVCEQGPTPTPCNSCSQCTAVMDGSSVDVVEIDGASNNSVDHIRNLRDQVHYLPQFARRKIYIIDEVHMLSASAFNALLKTLEEPPPHVTFIFATTDPHKVLPTILSRVSRLDFRRVRARELVAHLSDIAQREGVRIAPEALTVVVSAAEGSVRDALTSLDKLIAFGEDPSGAGISGEEARAILGLADRSSVADLADKVFEGDATGTLEAFDEITQIGVDLQRFALTYLQHLRDLLVMATCGRNDALLDLPDLLLEKLEGQATRVDPRVIAQHFDRFSQVLEQLERSRVPKMVLEMGLLDLVHAEPLLPLGDLVERLMSLESGQGPSGQGGSDAGGRGWGGPQGTPQGRPRGRSAAQGQHQARSSDHNEAPARPHDAQREDTRRPVTPSGAPPRREAPGTHGATRATPRTHAQAPGPGPGPEPGRSWASSGPPTAARTRAGGGGDGRASKAERRPGPGPRPKAKAAGHQGMSGMAGQFAAMLGRGEDSFELAPPPAEDEAPSAAKPEAPPPDAGCPSSRCVPRDVVRLEGRAPFEAWELFLDQVRAEDELLFAVLADFGLAALEPGKLRLAAARGSFCADQLHHRPELRARLDELLAAIFGETMRLDFEDATPSLPELPSLSLVEATRKRAHRQRVERQARTHPGIRAVLDAFDGQLSSIEPLKPPPREPIDPAP